MSVEFRAAAVRDIDPETLYRILWLRVRVFVVEQAAAYSELDGRDIERDAVLMWAEEGGEILGTLRVLDDGPNLRIGRVATSETARGRGVGADLMIRAVDECRARREDATILLDAQEHLAPWYSRFGFEVSGARYLEDDIPHVPMARHPA